MASLQETIQTIEKEISCVQNSIKKLTLFQEKLDENRLSVKAEVNKTVGMLNSLLQQREEQLHQEIDSTLSSQLSSVQTKLSLLHQKLGSLQIQLQLAKEGKKASNLNLLHTENEMQVEAPLFKFQPSMFDNLQEAISEFGCIETIGDAHPVIFKDNDQMEHESIQNECGISKWLRNISSDPSSPSDFVMVDKETLSSSSPSIVSLLEEPLTLLEVSVASSPIAKCSDMSCNYPCKEFGSSCCRSRKETRNVDLESLYNTPWLKKSQEINENIQKQHPSLIYPKISEVCRANEKCKSIDQCLCDENCVVKALKQQVDKMELTESNNNYLSDTVNETIKESLNKEGEKNSRENWLRVSDDKASIESMWLKKSIRNQNEHKKYVVNNDKINTSCKRKEPFNEQSCMWLSKMQKLENNTEKEGKRCSKKHDFSIPECNWLKAQSANINLCSLSKKGKQFDFLYGIHRREFNSWLAGSKCNAFSSSPSVALNQWLKQSCSRYLTTKNACKPILPEKPLFMGTDMTMWLLENRC